MLLKFVGPAGPLIHPKLPKAIQPGEVFECPTDIASHYGKIAKGKLVEPTEAEAEAYLAKAKAKAPKPTKGSDKGEE